VEFLGKNEGTEDTLLEEPLLNGDSSESNEAVSNKCKGGDTVTPYSNAGIFSILTFSWIGPLIAVGNKKTLDVEGVPQLDPGDNVVGCFTTFRNKLEAECGKINRMTTLKLVKALISLAWKEILLTAILVIIYSLASYVGPYLIDTFVQYLNGRLEFNNEGYILVSVFFAAKVVECLSQKHWFFGVQQAGIKVQSVLITMIYNKSLTLSWQSSRAALVGRSSIS
jgi:ATP-binding cassette subfamily C (CFTR/MRP) protein 2